MIDNMHFEFDLEDLVDNVKRLPRSGRLKYLKELEEMVHTLERIDGRLKVVKDEVEVANDIAMFDQLTSGFDKVIKTLDYMIKLFDPEDGDNAEVGDSTCYKEGH